MGAVGGGVWHLLKGIKNSPSNARMRGGLEVRSFPGQERHAAGHFPASPLLLHRYCLLLRLV